MNKTSMYSPGFDIKEMTSRHVLQYLLELLRPRPRENEIRTWMTFLWNYCYSQTLIDERAGEKDAKARVTKQKTQLRCVQSLEKERKESELNDKMTCTPN